MRLVQSNMIRWCKTHELQALPTADKIEVCAGVWREGDCSIVDAVVLSRQPCPNCDGKGFDTVQSTRGPYETDDLPCPSCGGSGTTWPDELIITAARKLAESSDHLKNIAQAELFDLVVDLVLDALVVQEGDNDE